MRTPVITSDLSPMREVSGGAAFLANPFDAENIREGILKIIENSKYREELIKKGIENVKRFNAKKIARNMKIFIERFYLKTDGKKNRKF